VVHLRSALEDCVFILTGAGVSAENEIPACLVVDKPMSPRPYRLPSSVLAVALVGTLIYLFARGPVADLFRSLANLWSLGLIFASGATLVWFAYSVCLRRLLRVRRIANLRLRRMLTEGQSDSSNLRPD